jgi:hypothetical protein
MKTSRRVMLASVAAAGGAFLLFPAKALPDLDEEGRKSLLNDIVQEFPTALKQHAHSIAYDHTGALRCKAETDAMQRTLCTEPFIAAQATKRRRVNPMLSADEATALTRQKCADPNYRTHLMGQAGRAVQDVAVTIPDRIYSFTGEKSHIFIGRKAYEPQPNTLGEALRLPIPDPIIPTRDSLKLTTYHELRHSKAHAQGLPLRTLLVPHDFTQVFDPVLSFAFEVDAYTDTVSYARKEMPAQEETALVQLSSFLLKTNPLYFRPNDFQGIDVQVLEDANAKLAQLKRESALAATYLPMIRT